MRLMTVDHTHRRWWGITIGPLAITWYDLWEKHWCRPEFSRNWRTKKRPS